MDVDELDAAIFSHAREHGPRPAAIALRDPRPGARQ
jgi:hypothetical protein